MHTRQYLNKKKIFKNKKKIKGRPMRIQIASLKYRTKHSRMGFDSVVTRCSSKFRYCFLS